MPKENFENFYSGYWHWLFKKKGGGVEEKRRILLLSFQVFPDFIFVNIKRNFNYEKFKKIYMYYFVSCLEDFELWYCF